MQSISSKLAQSPSLALLALARPGGRQKMRSQQIFNIGAGRGAEITSKNKKY